MAKGLLSAGTFTRTRKSWWQRVSSPPQPVPEPKNSWWQRVSLAPEPVDRNQQVTANHDGKGSLKRRTCDQNRESWWQRVSSPPEPVPEPKNSWWQKGLFSAGTCDKTSKSQQIVMPKGFFSAEPLPELGNHDGKGSLWRQNLYIPEPKKSWWRRVSLAPEPVDRNQQITANHDGKRVS